MMKKTFIKKRCPNCGKKFSCYHSKDCWCIKYSLSIEQSNFLHDKYSDCLCEDCLAYFVKNDKLILKQK